MFGRAETQRTVFSVVALRLTAGCMNAFARGFRTADPRNQEYPAKAQRGAASAHSIERITIERIRKVE